MHVRTRREVLVACSPMLILLKIYLLTAAIFIHPLRPTAPAIGPFGRVYILKVEAVNDSSYAYGSTARV